VQRTCNNIPRQPGLIGRKHTVQRPVRLTDLLTRPPIVIHKWGWTLVLNPDGTTTAWNKDKTKTLHSHGPPARAG
jgi:hypothetical protein